MTDFPSAKDYFEPTSIWGRNAVGEMFMKQFETVSKSPKIEWT